MPKAFDLDALLSGWPAPERDASEWDERAAAILHALASAERLGDDELAALLGPPLLPDEAPPEGGVSDAAPAAGATDPHLSDEAPPESGVAKLSISVSARDSSGERNMSDDRGPSSEAPRKRQSLKEIAERASQSGRASLTSIPPSAASTPLPRSEAPRASIPPASIRPPASMRPTEASGDDSGVVDLKAVHANATPAQVAAAASAKPGAHGLLDDDEPKKAVVAASAAAPVAAPAPKKSGTAVGLVIAAVGIAAALFIVMRSGTDAPSPVSASPAAEAKPSQPVAQVDKLEAPAPAAAPAPTAEAVAQVEPPPEPPSASAPSATPAAGKGAASAGPVAVAAADTASAAAPVAPKPAAPAEPGDLAAAMAKAAGASAADKSGASNEKVEPAARGNASIPKQPPQGSVTSAIGSVMGGAKACVAGADDVSRAQLTFGSSGAVSSVNVTGWAAANGKAGCVKSAMKGAKVGPFQDPSFSVGVTIRP